MLNKYRVEPSDSGYPVNREFKLSTGKTIQTKFGKVWLVQRNRKEKKWELVEHEGYYFEGELMSGEKYVFVIHKRLKNENRWVISDPKSGLLILVGDLQNMRELLEEGLHHIKTGVDMDMIREGWVWRSKNI